MDCKIKSFLIKEQTVMRIEILFVLHLCYHEFCKMFKLVSIPAKVSLFWSWVKKNYQQELYILIFKIIQNVLSLFHLDISITGTGPAHKLKFLIFISSELESEVEMVRLDVVQKRCIANPAEVDSLNSQLSIISRQVSDLKGKFKLHYCHSSVP